MCAIFASMVKSTHVVTCTTTQKRVTHGYTMANCVAKAGTKKVKQFIKNVKMNETANLIK